MLHNNIEMLHNISPKSPKKFGCDICEYKCCKKSDFEKHLMSIKHKSNENGDKCNLKFAKNLELTCNMCNKIYKSRTGLWRHKKICNDTTPDTNVENTILDASSNEIKILTNLVIELVKNNTELQKQTSELQKQNQDFQKQTTELQKQIINVCQKIQPGNTHINSHNTTNNKTFNLQVFLNEECKDAMNMSEFINSIELKISDLVNIGKLGYVEGMSNIIIKQLNDTDINKRPVHCSDAKRETLYVKEENKWEKETQETKQMLMAVRGVNKKNYKLLANWKETHPDCMNSKSNQSDEYMKITSKVMDGDLENINKVIKKVAKEVVIDK
jgi:hypothetical protein